MTVCFLLRLNLTVKNLASPHHAAVAVAAVGAEVQLVVMVQRVIASVV